ncbi:MAG: transcription elongation factor GreA [Patescibacteria group bacterium]
MSNQTYLTPEGLEKIKEELAFLKSDKRKEISGRIQEAKEQGDLSENAEYTEAKNEQAFVEGKINELENIVKNVVIIKQTNNTDIVEVGSKVKVVMPDGQIQEYSIVGSKEADPSNGKISNESPIGQAFIGKRKDQEAIIVLPKGSQTVKIIDIS